MTPGRDSGHQVLLLPHRDVLLVTLAKMAGGVRTVVTFRVGNSKTADNQIENMVFVILLAKAIFVYEIVLRKLLHVLPRTPFRLHMSRTVHARCMRDETVCAECRV